MPGNYGYDEENPEDDTEEISDEKKEIYAETNAYAELLGFLNWSGALFHRIARFSDSFSLALRPELLLSVAERT